MFRDLTYLVLSGFLIGTNGFSGIPICGDTQPPDIYLDLSNTGLSALNRPLANSPLITCVDLSSNDISRINETAFDGLPELRHLSLAQNRRLKLDSLLNTSLQNLVSLDLDASSADDYYNYPSNQYNGLIIDPPSVALPNLQKLSLNSNRRYQYFLQIVFIPMLTHLYLARNDIRDFGRLDFKAISSITHLYLDDNYLSWVRVESKNVRLISLDRNTISKVCSVPCEGFETQHLPNLQYLSLESNGITSIDPDGFDQLANLRHLNLARNKIQHLPRHTFDNMTLLQNLTLNWNKLTTVPHICVLKELDNLSLRGNLISFVEKGSFCGLPKLALVDLRENQLTRIPDGAFFNLPSLSVINLSSNKISTIEEDWISPDNPVNELRLDDNKFTDISGMSLKRVRNATLLSFRNNPIRTISVKSLLDLPQDLIIDLSTNCT